MYKIVLPSNDWDFLWSKEKSLNFPNYLIIKLYKETKNEYSRLLGFFHELYFGQKTNITLSCLLVHEK